MSDPESTREAREVDPAVKELLDSRERIGISQREMADALAVHPSTLSRYESGKLKVPPEVIEKVRALVQGAEAGRRTGDAPAAPAPASPVTPSAPPPSAQDSASRPAACHEPEKAAPGASAPVGAPRAADVGLLARRLTVWGGFLAVGQLALLAGLLLTRAGGGPLPWSRASAMARGSTLPHGDPERELPQSCRRGEIEIGGSCWALLEVHAPCPDYAVEYGGKCYVSPPRREKPSVSTP